MARRALILFLLLSFWSGAGALAKPSQDDVFRSIQDSVSKPDESTGKLVPWVCAAAGVVMLLALFGRRQTRAATPRRLNNPNKLLKEVARTLPLKPGEIRQVRVLADETRGAGTDPVVSPLVLLLCPSVVGKAAQGRTTRADRRVLAQVLRKI